MPIAMFYNNGAGYTHCRSGSDSVIHRRSSAAIGYGRDADPFDSGDSTDLDESESGSATASGGSENSGSDAGIAGDPNLPYPGIAPISLRYLAQTTRPRSWCLALIANPWFERISMMVILLNCITLGMYQPCVDKDPCITNRCRILQRFDEFIFAFFSLEMTIKIIAMGAYGPGSYLADSWNRLDLFIVIAGAVEYGLPNFNNINLSAVGTIRVLRPLRAINRIPSMRILVMLLLDTLPMLGNVLLLCFFVFFIFGIVGVQLWQGVLRQRCMFISALYPYVPWPNISRSYKPPDTDYICSKSNFSGMHSCLGLPPFVNGSVTCQLTWEQKQMPEFYYDDAYCVNWHLYYSTCSDNNPNPFQNTISFDNIGLAWIAIFLVISLEGWTEIMYYVQDGHSFWDWIYFVLLIVIGSFFMINLCLVVIATQFSETKKREMERMRLERARFQSSSTLASSTNNSEPTTCYAEIVKYIAHLWRRSKRRVLKRIRLYRVQRDLRRDQKITMGETIRLNYPKRHHPNCSKLKPTQSQSLPSTRAVSRASSICLSDPGYLRAEDVQEPTPRSRPGLLRVPAISNQEISSNNNDSPTNLLSPTSLQNNRRRSSVMFSDIIVLHGQNAVSPTTSASNLLSATATANIDKKNVCSSEKTTQAGDGNIWQITGPITNPQQMLETKQQLAQECSDLMNGEALTCQELLALGAINAALPTGQVVLDSFFDSLSKGMNNRQKHNEEYYTNEEDFSCCIDMWHCEAEYKNETRSKLYVCSCMFIKGTIKGLKTIRKYIQILVEHKIFQHGILLAILINTLSMGIEHHQQSEWLTHCVEVTNVIFSAVFGVEMILKVIAEGPFGYISNGFNVFDGVIVILSAIELFKNFTKADDELHTDSGLSVLRTFRLLRILKLVRFMPNLRRQLFVMLRTMDNVAIFFSLLILFIFIFSILGMYLFGGKFCNYVDERGVLSDCGCEMLEKKDPRCQCDRKHFNNILWATVTVFQILTQEDWNMVLSNGMARTSHWAALYFVALMTFGNYVLFNLLVAILVEGFSSERNERREREQRELARRKMSIILEASFRDSNSSRSDSASSDSYINDKRNYWHSADEIKDLNGQKPMQTLTNCDFKDVNSKEKCYLKEPKCNIQKESMLRQPLRQASPPIITHTAATPQDSPNNTLDADFPEFLYNVTNLASDVEEPSACPSTTDSTTQRSSSLSLLKPPTLTPPPVTFRNFEKFPEEPVQTQAGKIVIHNEKIGQKTMSFSEKVVQINSNNKNETKQNPDKDKLQRKMSWNLPRKPSLRRKRDKSGSDSEAVPLNNGRDHSQCNGKGVIRHASLNRNDSLLLQSSIRIQNDTHGDTPNNKLATGRSPSTISPQNSFRCRSNTCSATSATAQQKVITPPPALTRRNSLTKSPKKHQHHLKLSPIKIPSKQCDHIELKPLNNLKDNILTDTTLPQQIKLEENDVGTALSTMERLEMWLEPYVCVKGKDDYSLYLFSPDNSFRHKCTQLVEQKYFDNVVLLFIALNCITLAMERPNIPPESHEKLFLQSCNYIFSIVFAFEMFVKVVASGMCYGPNAYFTSGWNIMDGSLVIISIVDILMFLINDTTSRIFGILRVFRLLRSLRPLRVINRAPGLKLVVQTLLSSLRPIGNIVLICCTFFIIFGILGVQLFKGTFYHCIGENLTTIITKDDCLQHGYDWKNEKYNFDDLVQALMSLFVLSSRDGWVNIMYTGLDAVGVDKQPVTNFNEWRLLYFISFILLVGFFVLNMFVGVVVENFHRCREEQEKEERIRRAAKRALQLEKRRRKMKEPPYYINYPPWRLFIHKIVTSKYFDLAIAAVIGLNVVTMATESYRMPPIWEYLLRIFNYFFTAVFILESIMKLIALGFRMYIKDKWNILDVVIVILSVFGIIIEEMKENEMKIIPINPTIIRVLRVMRIARVLKLLKMAKGVRALLDTVMQALPQVGNLGLLFFLLFFIFAALGVELFGRLDCKVTPCQGLGEHAHFENFGMAFLTLFRVATGDNWNGIMKDTLYNENCDERDDCIKNCCISPIIAPIFFVIFVLMAQFVLVNVVVAVLMKHLEESHKHLEDEQDMDIQLEREFQEKQEQNERRELCLALQLDAQECHPEKQGKLHKVLSLPSNFVFNPPGGTKVTLERQPSQNRRQTMHGHLPIMISNMEDMKNIDDSISDIYSIQEESTITRINLDEILTYPSADTLLKVPKIEEKKTNETLDVHRLSVPLEVSKSVNKLYGSTKHLFQKQASMEVYEETPFFKVTSSDNSNSLKLPGGSKPPRHDSQESVQRIITERRKLDDNFKQFDRYDIFDTKHSSEEHLVSDSEDLKEDTSPC